ncbi:ParB/RepB/Spo0J family partition protein [Cognatishimia sp. F0-27]|uniref:ParB/RepB/Spo0J family partition protein n=1 Tax=Cognatishimia sp. F0-27 TaxID=2816855 RepID=UPI001D0CD0A3|nr:ParB/RepB/Spo0J family partition protein [Cognatishimia sp. F0-27]MCC1492456.1 ParB/RepB/Spo0J family partition protein [Cognatishimia sp. F0-27]
MNERKEPRRGLGRGLSALMADVEPAVSTSRPAPDRTIPIEQIAPNPDQPRRSFSDDELKELAASIATKGIIQPIIVRKAPSDDGTYQIVAGERRWRAAQMAQLHEVPAIIRDFTDIEILEVAIIENIQRADLNPIEEAAGYKQLMHRFGHTQEKLSEALGKSRSHIANLMRLLNLPDSVQDMVSTGVLTAGHARALITAPNPEELAEKIRDRGLTVREAERLAKEKTPKQRPNRMGALELDGDADTRALEADLSAALGMSVKIEHKPNQESGRVSIKYDTLEKLDALCAILGSGR